MTEPLQLELPSGAVLELEVDPDTREEYIPASTGAEAVRAKVSEAFKGGIGAAAELAALVQQQFRAEGLHYRDAELRFGITLSAAADLKVVRGEAEGLLHLRVTWRSEDIS